MIAQLDLPISSKEKRHIEEDVARLLEYLTWHDYWITAKSISVDLDMSDRYIRKLAEASDGKIIGTDNGYKLTRRVTPEEFNEWRGRYESQIKRMLERVQRTSSQWHRRAA
jgi:hypothetical protein